MGKVYNGTAVPRHFVFISSTGAVVVQLSVNRGQELYTGKFVTLTTGVVGNPASDAELDRLKIAGRVEHYNSAYVWVTGLPERHVYEPLQASGEQGEVRARSYYINTMLPTSELEVVQDWLEQVQLSPLCTAELRAGKVAITGTDGALFGNFDQAEEIRLRLLELAPNEFASSIVAFANFEQRDSQLVHELRPRGQTSELEAIIASQTDTTMTAGKTLLLLVNSLDERKLIYNLCVELQVTVQIAASAAEALNRLEDEPVDLLIMDIQLPDMHGWELLGKLREVEKLRHLPIILIADHAMPEDASLTKAVATADVYLERPLAKARLRQNIWLALSGQ